VAESVNAVKSATSLQLFVETDNRKYKKLIKFLNHRNYSNSSEFLNKAKM
jgi:hypothetical protein